MIYRFRWWGGKSSESASGHGSSLAATRQIREELPRLLKELECQKLLDLGCGDFHWMKEVALPCNYIGADIVASVISENSRKYAKSGIEFMVLDATEDALPADVDVLLCREVLFHLSFRDIRSTMARIKASNVRYLLLTQVETGTKNQDIRTGEFRPLDLSTEPFMFPKPRASIRDDTISEKRYIALWRVEDIPVSAI
jgi:2-polyprenyl-3-methyl-5-hydroxy-6-metoxy-1,4-benzoquinol methylase